MPNLLIRPDCRDHVGLGHLVRGVALAEAWIEMGGRVTLAVDRRESDLGQIVPDGIDVVQIGANSNGRDVISVANRVRAAWVVVDGYDFDVELERSIRGAGHRVMVMDDFGQRPHDADLVVDQNIAAERGSYGPGRVLLGPRYALIRAGMRAARELVVEGDDRIDVLVTFGGSAPGDGAEMVTALVEELDARIETLGPGFGPIKDRRRRRRVTNHGIVPDPAPYFRAADLVVGAAGSTTLELCHLGVPSVLMALAPNQEAVGAALARAGAAIYLGRGPRVLTSEVITAVRELLVDPVRRGHMSEVASGLVDGEGAARVSRELLAEVSGPVRLSPSP